MKIMIGLMLVMAIGCEQPQPQPIIIQIVSPTIDERKETAFKEYNKCMDNTMIRYHKMWDSQCVEVQKDKPGCILYGNQGNFVVTKTISLKQDCQNAFNNKMKLIE